MDSKERAELLDAIEKKPSVDNCKWWYVSWWGMVDGIGISATNVMSDDVMYN